MTKTKPVISAEQVSFSYDNDQILREVSFDIFPGDFVSIIGPNGGGKTTLAKLILGLLVPDSGKISVLGASPEKSRIRTGYVPQYSNFDPRFPILVEDVVRMGLLSGKPALFTKGHSAKINHALDKVEIADLKKKCFSDLSGGQRQRVLIARALATEPELLILDEPTANVDPKTEDRFYKLLKELSQDQTVLLITHDLGFASKQVTKVICVNRKVCIHPTGELTQEVLNEYYGTDMEVVLHHKHI